MKLEIKGVCFNYGSKKALDNVTITIGEGEVVSIVGPNGSGKSTLLKCINRILKAEGTILIDGKDVQEVKLRELAKVLGYVPQSVNSSFPSTVFDAILLGRKPYVNWSVSQRDVEIASNFISLMGLKEMALRQTNELSGGERQKVFIARALAQEPEILLLDEPTSNLDMKHQLEVLEIIKNIVKERKISAIIAIHDLNLAARYSDKILIMNNGRIFAAGEPLAVLTQENIRHVYRVDAIVSLSYGIPFIVPLSPSKNVSEEE